jgi:DNA-directed RNA polymerase specialized sigma24 family protein
MTNQADEELSPRPFEESLKSTFVLVSQRLTRRYGDPQLAEEVTWDCLTRAFEVWMEDPHYFEEHDLTAWISQRATWRALDRLRERSKFAPLVEEHASGEEDGESPHAPLIDLADEEAVQGRERDRQITWESLQQLDENDRRILEGYYYDHRTDQELGAQLYDDECSDQARGLRIWRRRQKAHALLERLLVENGIDPTDYTPIAQQAL